MIRRKIQFDLTVAHLLATSSTSAGVRVMAWVKSVRYFCSRCRTKCWNSAAPQSTGWPYAFTTIEAWGKLQRQDIINKLQQWIFVQHLIHKSFNFFFLCVCSCSICSASEVLGYKLCIVPAYLSLCVMSCVSCADSCSKRQSTSWLAGTPLVSDICRATSSAWWADCIAFVSLLACNKPTVCF